MPIDPILCRHPRRLRAAGLPAGALALPLAATLALAPAAAGAETPAAPGGGVEGPDAGFLWTGPEEKTPKRDPKAKEEGREVKAKRGKEKRGS